MEEKIIDELQKLYDNSRIGALVQEICEYFATKDNYENGSYEDEIEPPELTEAAYTLFCLQAREQILDEFALVSKKYPSIYDTVRDFHQTLLVNMDYRSLEESAAGTIAGLSGKTFGHATGESSGDGSMSAGVHVDSHDDGSMAGVTSGDNSKAGASNPGSASSATVSDILSQTELCVRTSDNLSEALDKFYRYLHSKRG